METLKMNWISVKDQMPSDGKEVIIFSDGIVMCGVFYYESKGFIHDFGYTSIDATHWMPLPEPPKV